MHRPSPVVAAAWILALAIVFAPLIQGAVIAAVAAIGQRLEEARASRLQAEARERRQAEQAYWWEQERNRLYWQQRPEPPEPSPLPALPRAGVPAVRLTPSPFPALPPLPPARVRPAWTPLPLQPLPPHRIWPPRAYRSHQN